jgi:hypothetical protein
VVARIAPILIVAIAGCVGCASKPAITSEESLAAIKVAIPYASKVYHIDCRTGMGFRYAARAVGGMLVAEIGRKASGDRVRVAMRRSDLTVVKVERVSGGPSAPMSGTGSIHVMAEHVQSV